MFRMPSAGNSNPKSSPVLLSSRRLALSAEQPPATTTTKTETKLTDGALKKGRFGEKREEEAHSHTTPVVGEENRPRRRRKEQHRVLQLEAEQQEERRMSLKDYFEQAKDLIRSDGGPPRWFSPLECGSRLDNSPLLLFLPG